MTESELTQEQIVAIKRSIDLGRTLQDDHPEIEKLWREGLSLVNIVEKLDVESNYRVSPNVAFGGVYLAIAGSRDMLGIEGYAGLINPQEREVIGREHRQMAGSKSLEEKSGIHGLTPEQRIRYGIKNFEEGFGIHGLTLEQRRENAVLGGRISGRKHVTEKSGIFGLTPEQRKENSSRAGRIGGSKGGIETYEKQVGIHGLTQEKIKENSRKAILSLGQVPASEDERKMAYELSKDIYFMNGPRISNLRIAQALNGLYHNSQEIRTPDAVGSMIWRYKKSLEPRPQSS